MLSVISSNLQAQGCVAVKNMSSHSFNFGDDSHTGWQLSLNYRYFRSYKHFRGKEEEHERVENGTEVINNDNSINLGIGYTFSPRWNIFVSVPYIYIDRSSLYEHLGNDSGQRFHTQSQGFGDVRVVSYFNIPTRQHSGNIALGLGFKAPTGNYHVMDYFQRPEGLSLRPVDQSIQLGDGGWGLITEVDVNQKISGNFSGYLNAMYMFSPRNTNGVLRSPTNTTGVDKGNEFSVADQYLVRAGVRMSKNNFQFGLGGRMECIPAEDILGKSQGFRRPGYIVSAEPSVFYMHGAHTFGVNVPVALARNRTQSVLDKERTKITGTYQHGDAAFADWLVSFTYAYRLMKNHE
jgi:hypothetical protein